ncbi:MAG TPA: hypothetical protein VJV23_15640 [Candidatus Polarisedimenticolia bacterium]|nr:hypothetical protein [Candidatus Polarisedimenticolia bacterium]
MHRRRAVTAFLATAILGPGGAEAKDVKGLWYVSASAGFHVTSDDIRSNASMPSDPRPSDFQKRAGKVEDGAGYALSAGYGMSDVLALQLDAGWFQTDVGPVDAFLEDRFPVPVNPQTPNFLTGIENRRLSYPVAAGSLLQIPVSLSLVGRFRKDRTVNPFLGAGAGMIHAEFEPDDELHALNDRLAGLRVRSVADENGAPLVTASPLTHAQGLVSMPFRLLPSAEDAFAWHLLAGIEWFAGERVSVVASVRAVFTKGAVDLRFDRREDQITLSIFSEKLFRPDGSLRIFNDAGLFPNPLIDPDDASRGTYKCSPGNVGDFDGDGHRDDLCYRNEPFSEFDDPTGTFLIQGGEIELGGAAASLGLRFHF